MTFDPSIFRAYDLRGTYPQQINEEVAYAAGQAFVAVLGARSVVVGRDVRTSGPQLEQALIRGITEAGASVIEVGVISTEMLYFAAATLECDGGLAVTASHNPAEWNGLKMVGKGAAPMNRDGDLGKVYARMQEQGQPTQAATPGTVRSVDILDRYAEYLQSYRPADLPTLTVVANTNFGANGKVVDKVCQSLPLTLARLNWQEDGSFPKGAPDPSLPKNRQEIAERVVSEQAAFGVAWDADADRCFFYDNQGRPIPSYYIASLLIERALAKQPGSPIVVEPRLTWAIEDAVAQGGGRPVPCRVGHSFIKEAMRREKAAFCGEVSGHFYYQDFFYCDNGMVTFLTVLGLFAEQIRQGGTVAQLHDRYREKYPIVPQEMNYITDQAAEITEQVAATYADGQQDRLDGISVEYPSWRFNLRSSNTEPLLRVNLEARSQAELAVRQQELQQYLADQGAQLRDDNH